MALKTKAKIAKIGEALGKKSQEFTFIDPPMIDVPFTTINKLDDSPRQLPDPSLSLKPVMGVERVVCNKFERKDTEKGSNGEIVYESDDARIRFVGSGWNRDGVSFGTGITTQQVGDYLEITYFGTGLNLLLAFGGSPATVVDQVINGVSIGTLSIQGSAVITNRQYKNNQPIPIIENQTLGVHTARFELQTFGSFRFDVYGFEVLNESAQIQVPQGEVFAAGNKFVNDALTTTDYNTGFDGSPVLNGRGGRVSIYMTPEGKLEKAIQQTDAAQLNLGATNHSNEEVTRRINFREFGVMTSDDFGSLTTVASDRAFTLDDGTTTLVGDNIIINNGFAGLNDSLAFSGAGASFTLTFVGTGLDVYGATDVNCVTAVLVDGVNVGNMPNTNNLPNIIKVVSGLPYGTHTVKFDYSSGGIVFHDFITYGPKKPDIPADAQEISEYYLMADYDGSSITGTAVDDHIQRASGVLQKACTRELVYTGTWNAGGGNDVDNPSGLFVFSTTINDYYEYTFFGEGIVIQHQGSTAGTFQFEVQIDGAANDTGVVRSNATNDGSGNYSSTTTTSNAPVRVEFTGLPLGKHTVRVTLVSGAGNMGPGALYIITPTHFPNTKTGSLSIGPGIQLQKETSLGGIDLSKAKAWITYRMTDDTVLESYNISAVVALATGVRHIYFQKPFKTNNYAAIGTTSDTGSNTMTTKWSQSDKERNRIEVQTRSSTTGGLINTEFTYVFFGELEEEGEE